MHIFHTHRYRLLLTDMFTVSNLWALVELCEARRSRDTGAEEGPSDSEAFRCILWYSLGHELEWNQDTTNPWHVSRCNLESTQSTRSSIYCSFRFAMIRPCLSLKFSQFFSISFSNHINLRYAHEFMLSRCILNKLLYNLQPTGQLQLEIILIYPQPVMFFFSVISDTFARGYLDYVLPISHPTSILLQKLCRASLSSIRLFRRYFDRSEV